jgi:hypothetical protein
MAGPISTTQNRFSGNIMRIKISGNSIKIGGNMDELVKLVSQKAGITQDQAKTAVTTVLGFLKERLPAPVAVQLEGILSGNAVDKGLHGLGGMLGKN